jgi:DNA-binding winged helix-turn-helix (wHTH) protein
MNHYDRARCSTLSALARRLSPQRAEIMHIFAERMPKLVSRQLMVQQLWSVHEPSWPMRQLDVNICALRRMLPPGLELQTVPAVGASD